MADSRFLPGVPGDVRPRRRDRSHEIESTRGEAVEVDRVLADLDAASASTEAATIGNLRGRFEETFDLENETR